MPEPFSLPLPPLVEEVRRLLPAPGETYLVGGAVRDLLLGREVRDLDLAVPSGGLSLARLLGDSLGGACFPLDEARGVGRVVLEREGQRLEIDVADFRAADLTADLRARDFTMNSMALTLEDPPRLVDPHGGRADIFAGTLRLLSEQVLEDDPLRSLRAVRFAAQLGFSVEPRSREWIHRHAPALAGASGERVRDELFAALRARAAGTLRELRALGLLGVVLPEVAALEGVTQGPPHRHDAWDHTVEVVALLERLLGWISRDSEAPLGAEPGWPAVERRLAGLRSPLADRLRASLADDRPVTGLLLLAAILHDCGKAATRSVGEDGRIHFYRHEEVGARQAAGRLQALRFARAEIQWMASVVRHHLRPLHLAQQGPLSDRALHRFHRTTAPLGPEICLLSLADNLAKGEGRAGGDWRAFVARLGELLDAWFLRRRQVVDPEPLVRGRDLLEALGLPPGPRVGRLLRRLLEAQASGEIGTREDALALARRLTQGR